MARLPRVSPPEIPQHIIQRGVNRQACFTSKEDFSAYAHWLEEAARKNQVAIHSWVFMTNHVHLLATPETPEGISRMMQTLGRYYVRYFNHTHQRTGTLWEGRFKSCVVNAEEYLLVCQRYIELNPVRAGMVATPEEYTWSSYKANGLGKDIKLWTPHPIYQALGENVEKRANAYRSLFSPGHLDTHFLCRIRYATNKGLALGNNEFKQQVEALTGRKVTPLKRGPKPKSKNKNKNKNKKDIR